MRFFQPAHFRLPFSFLFRLYHNSTMASIVYFTQKNQPLRRTNKANRTRACCSKCQRPSLLFPAAFRLEKFPKRSGNQPGGNPDNPAKHLVAVPKPSGGESQRKSHAHAEKQPRSRRRFLRAATRVLPIRQRKFLQNRLIHRFIRLFPQRVPHAAHYGRSVRHRLPRFWILPGLLRNLWPALPAGLPHLFLFQRPGRRAGKSFVLFLSHLYSLSARYRWASMAAIAPSDAAVTIWRKSFTRISPAANTPGMAVCIFSSVGI